jgi:hypothetical protein
MSLIDSLLPEYKIFADIGHDKDDNLCRMMLETAMSTVETRFGIKMEQADIREIKRATSQMVRPTYRPDHGIVHVGGRMDIVADDGCVMTYMPSVELSYRCGWATAASMLPAIKNAVMRIALHLQEHRGDAIDRSNVGATLRSLSAESDAVTESGAMALLRPYRRQVA